MKHATFVIAEVGVNHNGDIDLAKKLVETAATCGADAVKFQSFKTENLVSKFARKADYQRERAQGSSQHDMLKRLEISESAHLEIINYCNALGIEFMSTAFDADFFEFLVQNGIKRAKIPSGEITNFDYLRAVSKSGIPIILSTGMSTLSEVGEALKVVEAEQNRNKTADLTTSGITLLHCTSEYPTQPKDVNMRAMMTLAKEYNLPVGYSDHTSGIMAPILAVGLGATVIEKHITINREMEGPDHAVSLEPSNFAEMVSKIREVEIMLGSSKKEPTPGELEMRAHARRSIVAIRNISAGSKIGKNDLGLMRPGTGIEPKHFSGVVGRFAKTAICEGQVISWSDLR